MYSIGFNGSFSTPFYLTFYIDLPADIHEAIIKHMGFHQTSPGGGYYFQDSTPPEPSLKRKPPVFHAVETVHEARLALGLFAKVVGPGHPYENPLCYCEDFGKAGIVADMMNVVLSEVRQALEEKSPTATAKVEPTHMEFPTWNEFLNYCKNHGLDPDRQFSATYSGESGDLVGTFFISGGGAVTWRKF